MVSGPICWMGKSRQKIWRITNLNPAEDVRVNSQVYTEFLMDLEEDVTDHRRGLLYRELPITVGAKPHLKFAKQFLNESEILESNYKSRSSPDVMPIEVKYFLFVYT